MNERLFQYIWQFQLYNSKELRTTQGEEIKIINHGQRNFNQGPDFLDARIQVGDHVLVGNIELHIRSGDWLRHKHQGDLNYANVILHVVWKDDLHQGSLNLPTLELFDRISRLLLQQYSHLQNNVEFIPCGKQVNKINALTWQKWKERLLIERLQRKSLQLSHWLEQNHYHWEETLWWTIARSFGMVVNSESFLMMAMSVPFSLLKRHFEQVKQLEAILFGQAGLLKEPVPDDYTGSLLSEYVFLKEKYGLKGLKQSVHFLRMRPASFPTIRIAQLAMFINMTGGRIGSIIHCRDPEDARDMLNVPASEYWDDHYVFGEKTGYSVKRPGSQVLNGVLLNGIIPFMYKFGEHFQKVEYLTRATDWMMQLAAEKNSITQSFAKLGVQIETAADSQALLEMKSAYCHARRCLECAVGNEILRGRKE